MKTISRLFLVVVLTLSITSLFGQGVFYTVSGEVDEQRVSIDSILFENLHNDTRLLFDNLSAQPDYVINLSAQTLWGATGVEDLKFEPGFSLLSNRDGNLSIGCNITTTEPIHVSIFNVQGQSIYSAPPMQITAGNAINIQLAKTGVYFVKLESKEGTKTFKALGSNNVNAFDVALNYHKPLNNKSLKSSLNTYDSYFSFEVGDSIRVSVYKDGFFTMPNIQPILASIPINFVFDASTVNETGITDTYVDIPDEMQDSLNFNVSTGEIIVTGDINLTTGNVIVIDADTSGFLRKVVNVRDDNGTIVLETVQAYLNEIFVEADFMLNTEFIEPSTTLKSTSSTQEIIEALTDEKGYIHPVKVVYTDKYGIINTKSAFEYKATSDESFNLMDYYNDISGTDLYGNEGDNIRLYIEDGHTSFAANAKFEFDFDDEGHIDEKTKVKIGDINSFKFYLEAQAGFKTVLALDMNASYTNENTEKLFNFSKAKAKFIVPPGIPLWIDFDCDVYGSYAFNADASLHADWGFESNHSLQAGGLYERSTNAFSPINEYTPENTIYPLNLEGEVNASARFEIFPRVDIKFYSIIGPYAEVVPFVDAGYNAAFQTQITNAGTETFLAWNSGLDLGLDFRLGVDLSMLGLKRDFGPSIINAFNTPLWRSPESIELLTVLPTDADEGTVLNLTFKVTDLLNLPVPLCPVYIEGDGNFNKQIAITDINGEVDIEWASANAGEYSFTASIYNADKSIIEEISKSVNIISQPINENLIAYYPFNGNANDESGNENDGIINGSISYSSDRFINENSAGSFNGDGSYFSTGFIMEQDWSISFWHNPQLISDNDQFLLLGDYSVGNDIHLKYTNGELLVNFVSVSTNIVSTLSLDTWYHIVLTYDGTNVKVYQDNTLISTIAQTPDFNFSSSVLRIGSRYGSQAASLYIDDFKIYDYTISDSEINELYYENGWEDNNPTGEVGTFVDPRDGQTYSTIEIGNQTWFSENLNYETDNSYWYNNSSVNEDVYGRLYTWNAATTACPSGWHLPSGNEWTVLTEYLINNGYGYGGSGDDIGKSMAATSGWTNSSDPGDVGYDQSTNNSSGLIAFPGGKRLETGTFEGFGDTGVWWSAYDISSSSARSYALYNHRDYIATGTSYKTRSFSVRCLKD